MGTTLPEIYLERGRRIPNAIGYHIRKENCWYSRRHWEAERLVAMLTLGLHRSGVRNGDRVALWGEASEAWALMDLAAMACGAVVVGIHPFSSPAEIRRVMRLITPRAIFVDSQAKLEVLRTIGKGRQQTDTAVLMEDSGWADRALGVFDGEQQIDVPSEDVLSRSNGSWQTAQPLSLSTICRIGAAHLADNPQGFDTLVSQVSPSDPATIIFTSGSSGHPKGAVFTHQALVRAVQSLAQLLSGGPDDLGLVYLPLSQMLQRLGFYWAALTGTVGAFEGQPERMSQTLWETRPTILASVPLFWERVYARLLEEISRLNSTQKAFATQSISVARQVASERKRGDVPGLTLGAIHYFYDQAVYRNIREAMGNSIRLATCGGDMIDPSLLSLLDAVGIPVFEGWGLTEVGGVVSLNQAANFRFGTVGKPQEGITLKVSLDGEIHLKGSTMFSGYYGDAEASRQVFDDDGWFCTGDLAEMDGDGFLRILGRKDASFRTEQGHLFQPSSVECAIRTEPMVAHVCVHGQGRPFPVALIALDPDEAPKWADRMGVEEGVDDLETLAHNPMVRMHLQRTIDRINRRLPGSLRIHEFEVIERPLSMENGEICPGGKMRRSALERSFASLIERIYTGI